MKNLLLTLAFVLLCMNVFSQTTTLTIDCQTPGWLSSLLTYSQQKTVEELTLTGYVNKTDVDFVNDLIKNYNLKVLDLSNVTTISDGKEHYLWNKFLSFGSDIVLQKVRLPLQIEGASGSNGSVVCSKVDTLEIGWEDLSVIGNLSIWNTHAKHLILLDGVQIIPDRYFMIQEDYDAYYYDRMYVDYHVSLPNSITKIGAQAFGRSASFDEPFSFPDNTEYIGKHPLEYVTYYGHYGSANGNCWRMELPTISNKKFAFPKNMRFYQSLDYTTYTDASTKEIITHHEFVSDTIIVHEKCDTLFAKLKAKVAIFYNRTPTKIKSPDDLWIDTLYVPDGCLSAYKNNETYRMAHSTVPNDGYGHGQINAIKEMKTVKGIEIAYNYKTCQIGENIQLSATIVPEDAFNKKVIWSSSDEVVANVTPNGLVITKQGGEAWIRVVSEDNPDMKDSCKITVLQPVTGITLNHNNLQFEGIGEIYQLDATIIPSDATNKNIRWTSSDESVCVVSQGTVYTVGKGTCAIVATTEDGGYVAICVVSVASATGISSVEQNDRIMFHVYDVNGMKCSQLKKGINIIQYKDGRKKKVLIK